MFRSLLATFLLIATGCGEKTLFNGETAARLPSQDMIIERPLECQIDVSRDKITLGDSVTVALATPNANTKNITVNNVQAIPGKPIQFTPTQIGEFVLVGSAGDQNTAGSCKASVSVGEPKILPEVIPPSCDVIVVRQPGDPEKCDLTISSTGGPIEGEPIVNPAVVIVLAGQKWGGTRSCDAGQQIFEVEVRNSAGSSKCKGQINAINTENFILTTSVTGSGSISKNPDAVSYALGSKVTLTANPAAGHRFVNWGGACSGNSPTCTVTMDSNKSVSANFTINTYSLTTSVTGSGAIIKNPDAVSYAHGSKVTLTANPAAGHRFANWGGACSGNSPTCTVTMDSNKSVSANFTINTYSLTTSVTGGGAISKNPDAVSYAHGSTVTLTANPAAGHRFANWGGACSGNSPICTVTMDGNKSVTADMPALNSCSIVNLKIGADRILGANSTRYNFNLKNLVFPVDVQDVNLKVVAISVDDYFPIISINGTPAVSVVESDTTSHVINVNQSISSFIKGGTNTVTCSVMNRFMKRGDNWVQCVYVQISGSYKTAGQCTENSSSPIYQY